MTVAALVEVGAALLGEPATPSTAATLVRLATGRAPAFALGAGGETALARVRRMLHLQAPLDRRERLTGLVAVASLPTGPAALAAAPGLSVFLAHHCHALLGL
ncbi:hypothetical protein [Nonomuraea sp. NPDC050643]|uniref:hypothetical protein n=1 Tax=Nonomuraea sp. NPDC050643 TaxID=3155660 RepID=UPI0033CD40BB